jgi:hypothetical protein
VSYSLSYQRWSFLYSIPPSTAFHYLSRHRRARIRA